MVSVCTFIAIRLIVGETVSGCRLIESIAAVYCNPLASVYMGVTHHEPLLRIGPER
ncbi:hypothetical protein D3C73_1464040 [compost metagenome]